MDSVEIAGISVPKYGAAPSWIPNTQLVLTATTRRNLQKILPPLSKGYNILLVGDAGVGKNALIYYINQIRQHPTLRYSFNEDTLPEDLIGSYRIDPGSHSFIWSDGSLAHALRSGATYVADEMNLCPPEVLKRFSSLFTDRRLQLLEGDLTILQAAPGFNFIATQNPAEGFEGRKNLPREIQKYFATVYIDPYPQEELIKILSDLNPQLSPKMIEGIVEINQGVEALLLEGKVGSGDLEHYHFNIRDLNRLARRLQSPSANPYIETYDIYLRPFRQGSDRQKISEEIEGMKPVLQEIEEGDRDQVQMNINSATGEIHIGRARLRTVAKGAEQIERCVQEAVKILPPVPANLRLLEAIAASIAMDENILLECEANVEAEDYLLFFSRLVGRSLATITFSRGMHTADLLGGLKPRPGSGEQDASVEWVDGPLTAAVRRGDFILLKGLEAAGAELIEKLNMLLDDARALLLPPESGQLEPLHLDKEARLFAIKFFRNQRSVPTISRAFRNRFSTFAVPPLVEEKSLKELSAHLLGLNIQSPPKALNGLVDFHLQIARSAARREIGAAKRQPYQYGLTNLRRLCEHIEGIFSQINGIESADSNSSADSARSADSADSSRNASNVDRARIEEVIREGVRISYSNEIADPVERERAMILLERCLAGLPVEDLFSSFQEAAKKKLLQHGSSNIQRIDWDQQKYWRDAKKGRFRLRQQGPRLKKGLNINTPETGGNIKEGAHAWHGSDTQGNRGQGEPGAGGGAWGYRTEELYREFLKKRRPLWNYNIDVALEDFKETFGHEMERVALEFEHLFDPQINIARRYMSSGSRVDARRYLSYLAGRGDSRLFDKTDVDIEQERLKGVEIIFLINKGRRIFNFEYSLATLVALMSSAIILADHKIPFAVAGYSDLNSQKDRADIVWYKSAAEELDQSCEERLFYSIAADWHGDTTQEAAILKNAADGFTPDSRTRILAMISDFRGYRGKLSFEHDLQSYETAETEQAVQEVTSRGILPFGAGVGARSLAEHIFKESLQVGGENFASLPSLLAGRLGDLICRYHRAASI